MSERYFLAAPPGPGAERLTISGPEANHLLKVLRKKTGDELLLFDGAGSEYRVEIESIEHRQIECLIQDVRTIETESELDLTLAVALPKGDRQRWLLEKLTELGVRRFVPIRAERSDIKIDENVLERLRRQVVEASKQCGRLRLMEVLPEMSRDEFDQSFPFEEESREDSLRLIAHPGLDGDHRSQSLAQLQRDWWRMDRMPCHIAILIGPAGGWSDGEVRQALDAGWQSLDLGPRICRVETAAMVLAALLLQQSYGIESEAGEME